MSRSSAKAEYRVMAHTTCEMVCLKILLMEYGFRQPGPMPMHCDNQSAIYIAQNHVSHERTKHVEIVFYQRCLDEEGGYVPVHTVFKAVG